PPGAVGPPAPAAGWPWRFAPSPLGGALAFRSLMILLDPHLVLLGGVFATERADGLDDAGLLQPVPDFVGDIDALLGGGDVEVLIEHCWEIDLDLEVSVVILERVQRCVPHAVQEA